MSAPSAVAAENLVLNGGFEAADPTEGWMIPSGWKVEEKAGPDGSRALIWENADPNRYTFPIYGVDYEPGAVYRFGVKMRADRLETGKPYVNLEWSSTNRVWLGNCESTVVRDNDVSLGDGWVRYEGKSAPMPPDVGRGSIVCFLPKGSTGRIRVDDFFIEKESVEPVASFVSSAYRDEVVSGKVRFFAALNLNPRRHPVADCAAELGYAAADGTRKTVRADRFTASEAHFELDASAFAEGPQTLGFRVRHVPTGTTVGGRKLAFSRVKAPTARRVSVDGGRRLTVDGKRYFPLGLYVGKMTEADFVEYNKGPFNSAVRYGNIYPSEMDAFHRHGIMVSPDLRGFASVMDLKRDEGELKAKIEAKVREIGSHPALLTWYVIDEAPPAFIGRLSRATAWLHAADPNHPTFAVLDKPHHVCAFLPAYDIVAIDTYPIGYNGGADVSKVAARVRTVDEAMFGYREMWMIPQAFNWAWYRKGEDLKKPNLRMPTREEMANMAWQSVAAGANGLYFYSFKDLRSHLSGAEFDREWAKVCDVGREIKGVESVLLSDDDAAAAEGWDRGKLAVRVFAAGGRRWLLAANRTMKPVKTTFALRDGAEGVKTLVGGGLSVRNRMAAVDLPVHGYALGELKSLEPQGCERNKE